MAVRFVDLLRWDLKTAIAAGFRAAHPDFVPLGNFAEECSELVRPFDQPETLWPVYGVNNRGGVFFSHHQAGAEFNAPYKAIRKDWFFHNPTRANVGSLGRVPEVEENAITSPEYQVWRIKDESWLPEYVEILIQMPFFNTLIQVHRVGAVKERLYAQNLLEIPVPPRSMEFQRAIVRKWREARAEIDRAGKLIEVLEQKMLSEILDEAGIAINISPKRPKAFAMGFPSVERWGVEFNRHRWTPQNLLRSTRFVEKPLSDVAWINPGGGLRLDADTPVSFVPMEAVSEVSGEIVVRDLRRYAEVCKGYTRFSEGDVIWAKITPCMQNGKSAVARGLEAGAGFGSTEFHVVRVRNEAELLPEFVWILLRLEVIRNAAQRFFIGSAGQQRVPAEFLEALNIPVPPIDIQEKILSRVKEAKRAIAAQRAAITELSERARTEIEAAILGGPAEAPWI